MKNVALLHNRKNFSLLLLCIILIVSIYPRLWNLTYAPPMIVDEPANLRDIDKIFRGEAGWITDFEWGFGQSIAIHYPAALVISILGEERKFFALRLTSVLLSLLALLPFYFITRSYSNEVIAFCATILFSFSYYYLQFSRVGWSNIVVVTLCLYLFWFLQLLYERRSYLFAVLAGIFAGLILYGYRAGEVYIAAAFIYLIFSALFAKKENRFKRAMSFIVFSVVFFVISLPWLIKIISNWERYTLRSRVVSVFNASLPYHGKYELDDVMQYQLDKSLRAWVFLETADLDGVENPRYLPDRTPLVNPLVKITFWIGIVLAFIKIKRSYILLFIFAAGLYFGQILTIDPPNGSRGLILLPIIYILSSLAMYKIYLLTKRNRLILLFLVVLSLFFSYHDFLYYQYWMTWIQYKLL